MAVKDYNTMVAAILLIPSHHLPLSTLNIEVIMGIIARMKMVACRANDNVWKLTYLLLKVGDIGILYNSH